MDRAAEGPVQMRARIMVEVALGGARWDANSGDLGEDMAGWREGKCRAVEALAESAGDESTELAAMGAKNEIRFLVGYQRRHFPGAR